MIPVRCDESHGAYCCFCRFRTRYRSAIPERPISQQVPCCMRCARDAYPRYVPGRRAYQDLIAAYVAIRVCRTTREPLHRGGIPCR